MKDIEIEISGVVENPNPPGGVLLVDLTVKVPALPVVAALMAGGYQRWGYTAENRDLTHEQLAQASIADACALLEALE